MTMGWDLMHSENERLRCENAELRDRLEAERKQYEDEIARFQNHVNDLQSGMYINCVYCGFRYCPADEVPTTMAEALREHIEHCPKHPMSELKKRLEIAEESLRVIRLAARDHLASELDATSEEYRQALIEAEAKLNREIVLRNVAHSPMKIPNPFPKSLSEGFVPNSPEDYPKVSGPPKNLGN